MHTATVNTNHKMELSRARTLNEIDKLREWMFERVAPFAVGNILEIGSGRGNISDLFIQHEMSITLSDPSAHYCNLLQNKYKDGKNVNAIENIDLNAEDFEAVYPALLEQFDTVLSLNTTEHISHNKGALANAKKLLKPGGYLIVLVPAYFALYRELDRGFNRWHKYNKEYIQKLFPKDLKVIKTKYFNLVGIVRLFLAKAMGMNGDKTSEQQTMYHQLVPTFCIEDLAFKQTGLSVIAMAEKVN